MKLIIIEMRSFWKRNKSLSEKLMQAEKNVDHIKIDRNICSILPKELYYIDLYITTINNEQIIEMFNYYKNGNTLLVKLTPKKKVWKVYKKGVFYGKYKCFEKAKLNLL